MRDLLRESQTMATTRLERKRVLRRMLSDCGYTDDLIAENFPIWSPRRPLTRPDLVSFVHPDQHTMATAAILAPVAESEREVRELWLSTAAAIAAPAALIALPDHISLWSIGADIADSHRIADTPLASYGELTDRMSSLNPEAIQRFKVKGIQPTLFPVDITLLERSRRESRSYLTNLVEEAMIIAQARGASYPTSPPARLVIAAIAALMIRDKLKAPFKQTSRLIAYAQTNYPGYFDWISRLRKRDQQILDELIERLGSNVNFSGLEPSMVSDVYEQALVTPGQRRSQGTYYTPPELARQMLQMLPIETLAPEQRSIVDPACGSGTLLLAGADRLEQLESPFTPSIVTHEYLTEHLRGYDRDPFAIEISKINLLMNALPIGNSWSVQARDALRLKLRSSDQPWLIATNPPWQYDRTEGRRNEHANEFLSWIVEALQPGGFLTCVLPVSWLNSRTSHAYREMLLSRCVLLDVWRLPEATFASSRAAPAVIIAQKAQGGHPEHRVTLGKRVSSRRSLNRFYETGLPDYAYVTQPSISRGRLLGGPLSQLLDNANHLVPLSEVAHLHSGCAHRPGRPHRTLVEGTHRELTSAAFLPEFGLVDSMMLNPVRYPEDFHHVNRSDRDVTSTKVLVSAKRWAENPWRIRAGLDLIGVVPRETLYMVLPKSELPIWDGLDRLGQLYALLAILGSGLAACWVDELEPRRNISPQVYHSLPVPFRSSALRTLAGTGQKLVEATQANSLDTLVEASYNLERVVEDEYQLPKEAMAAIRRTLGGLPAPEGIIRYPEVYEEHSQTPDTSYVPSFGTVLDASTSGVRVWISGITDAEGELLSAPLRAPGWICQASADFTVSGNLADLSTAQFGLHLFDWLADERPALPDARATG